MNNQMNVESPQKSLKGECHTFGQGIFFVKKKKVDCRVLILFPESGGREHIFFFDGMEDREAQLKARQFHLTNFCLNTSLSLLETKIGNSVFR